MTTLTYPNESEEYRNARNALLFEEMALRRHIESVAVQRRALPPGGEVPEDYVFERIGENGMPEKVAMSKLFGRHHTLILYSFMYGPERPAPCPMCTHLLDSVNGGARHLGQRASLYVVAKSPIARLIAWARERGWAHLRFLSTAGNRYDADYFGDSSNVPEVIRKRRDPKDGADWDETMFNVFRLDNGTVRHFWGSELTWAPEEPGMTGAANAAIAVPAPSIRRRRKRALGPSRHDPRGARAVHSQARLLNGNKMPENDRRALQELQYRGSINPLPK